METQSRNIGSDSGPVVGRAKLPLSLRIAGLASSAGASPSRKTIYKAWSSAFTANLGFRCLSFLLCLFFCAAPADGDVVWIRGASDPVSGQIVSQSKDQVRIKVFADGKFGEVKTYPAAQVETTVVNIDPQRLADLNPDNPVAYRNYAEELSAQRSDPAAISLARRLYLLAATNSAKSELRSGSILGLISLATNESQRRKLELYRQLNDPDSRGPKLDSPPAKSNPPTASQRELMLKVIVAIRREDTETAAGLLSSRENRKSLKGLAQFCSLEELDQIAAAKQPSKLQLGELLSAELAIRQPEPTTNSRPQSNKTAWDDLAMEPVSEFSVLPNDTNVTQFDPGKSVYRSGVWVRPNR